MRLRISTSYLTVDQGGRYGGADVSSTRTPLVRIIVDSREDRHCRARHRARQVDSETPVEPSEAVGARNEADYVHDAHDCAWLLAESRRCTLLAAPLDLQARADDLVRVRRNARAGFAQRGAYEDLVRWKILRIALCQRESDGMCEYSSVSAKSVDANDPALPTHGRAT